MYRIAIFASGAGSNAQKIIQHYNASSLAEVSLVVCNKPGAGVIGIASAAQVPVLMIEKERFFHGDGYVTDLKGTDLIVLAGFLWKLPQILIDAFPDRIINIHPALLPKFGGKGMYGRAVHEAVLASGDRESGITIHFVDGHYDHGDLIFQARCPVTSSDTPETLQQKVQLLEHEWYGVVIERVLRGSA